MIIVLFFMLFAFVIISSFLRFKAIKKYERLTNQKSDQERNFLQFSLDKINLKRIQENKWLKKNNNENFRSRKLRVIINLYYVIILLSLIGLIIIGII